MPLNIVKSSGMRHYRVFYNCINDKGEKRQFERVFRKKDEAIAFAKDIYYSIYELVGMTEEVSYDYLFEEEKNDK